MFVTWLNWAMVKAGILEWGQQVVAGNFFSCRGILWVRQRFLAQFLALAPPLTWED